ncbi:MAG: serine/threonine protein kinase [Bdellovibrionales bacterium]|nr:serine/threonine protein kinase [Bdellovibrionales bacterium]
MHQFKPGDRLFERFDVVSKLGAGGSAVVYKCRAVHLREEFVALKLFPASIVRDTEASIRLSREMRTAFQVKDPNVTRYIDLARNDHFIGLVIEFVDGKPLEELLAELPKHGLGRALSIGVQLAQGLKGIHDTGIVHRDIKPGNVLVSSEWVAKITDFGLAVHAQELAARSGILKGVAFDETEGLTIESFKTTSSASLVGTPSYVCPEYVLDGSLDHRSDLYSLGVVLFEMTTGQLPHQSDSLLELFEQKVLHPAPRADYVNKNCPTEVALIIDRLLNRDPNLRYQTALELVTDLNSYSLQWHAENSRLSYISAQAQEEPPPSFFEFLFSAFRGNGARHIDEQQPPAKEDEVPEFLPHISLRIIVLFGVTATLLAIIFVDLLTK